MNTARDIITRVCCNSWRVYFNVWSHGYIYYAPVGLFIETYDSVSSLFKVKLVFKIYEENLLTYDSFFGLFLLTTFHLKSIMTQNLTFQQLKIYMVGYCIIKWHWLFFSKFVHLTNFQVNSFTVTPKIAAYQFINPGRQTGHSSRQHAGGGGTGGNFGKQTELSLVILQRPHIPRFKTIGLNFEILEFWGESPPPPWGEGGG